ncbi:MAG TPA: septal ring lytic transglycosylase RlpA family protein [Solirubrobacteraceae bacterium]|nr:septal ring lytic transglycosylase RlpA family protein [Solirubrobacteraceae bacterium]
MSVSALVLGAPLVFPALGSASGSGGVGAPPAGGSGSSSGPATADPGALPAPPPPAPGGVSLATAPGTLLGEPLAIRGAVAPADSRRAVSIERQQTDGSWQQVASAQPDSHGDFQTTWVPDQPGRVHLRSALASSGQSASLAAVDPAAQAQPTVYAPANATWYGPGFYGKRTACGQRLTRATMGVAHLTLSCGTPVEIYYHGVTVTVPVIDRGPYNPKASFDLTSATAKALGADGVARIGTFLPNSPLKKSKRVRRAHR